MENKDSAVRYKLVNKETGDTFHMIDGSGSFGEGTLSFDIFKDGKEETIIFINNNGELLNDEWVAVEM